MNFNLFPFPGLQMIFIFISKVFLRAILFKCNYFSWQHMVNFLILISLNVFKTLVQALANWFECYFIELENFFDISYSGSKRMMAWSYKTYWNLWAKYLIWYINRIPWKHNYHWRKSYVQQKTSFDIRIFISHIARIHLDSTQLSSHTNISICIFSSS